MAHACEFHETKEAREREQALRRKEQQKLKRERGKQKAVENNARVKALSEQRRKEREATAASPFQASTTDAAQHAERDTTSGPTPST